MGRAHKGDGGERKTNPPFCVQYPILHGSAKEALFTRDGVGEAAASAARLKMTRSCKYFMVVEFAGAYGIS